MADTWEKLLAMNPKMTDGTGTSASRPCAPPGSRRRRPPSSARARRRRPGQDAYYAAGLAAGGSRSPGG
jgi:hypothetical protein